MKYTKLGMTDIEVSKICLGTMTFGQQNTEEDGHEQLDYALSRGINFIDTAEMYSVPAFPETQGNTEEIIGTWLKKSNKRNEVILATKVTGPADYFSYIRKGPKFNKEQINEAIEGSLKRLQTDYVDLYQLHWPERKTNYFGQLGYTHVSDDTWEDNFLEVLTTLTDLVKEGKIRHFGISNETPWGAMRYLALAEKHGLARCMSIQNPYSLLNRTYEVGMAEVSIREHCGLLAYSPLAFGVLSGKYLEGNQPEKSRLTLFPRMARYSSDNSTKATTRYYDLAKENGLSLTAMSLAYINSRPFLTSNIIGATTMEQLKENIDSIDVELSDEVLSGIEEIHKDIPNPAP